MTIKMGLFERFSMFGVVILLDLLVVAPAATAATRRCPIGQFLPQDSLLDECRLCSPCPVNEIIRKPCTEDTDTECSPFYEFQNFNSFQGRAEMNLGKLMEANGESTDVDSQEDPENEPERSNTATGEKVPSLLGNQEHWKELSFGLIAALVIVTLSAVLYIVISQVLRVRRLRKNASPLHNEVDVRVYYRTDGYARDHHPHNPYHELRPLSARPYKSSPFEHIESQLEENQRYRRFWQRFLRPGSAQVLGGNEYIVTVDNLRNQEVVDQRRLLPMNVAMIPEEEVQIPLAHVHQGDHLPAPDGAEAANISLHSTDSGIVAGAIDHPASSNV